jgi:hypothetical protein
VSQAPRRRQALMASPPSVSSPSARPRWCGWSPRARTAGRESRSGRRLLQQCVMRRTALPTGERVVDGPKATFLGAGKQALIAGKAGPSTREQRLEVEVADLPQALGEAAIEIRVWKESAEGPAGPFEDHEVGLVAGA